MGKKFNSLVAATIAVSAIAPVANASAKFSDVTEKNSHFDAISQLAQRGIIKGYQDGTFRPGIAVTRGQAAKIITGILNIKTDDITSKFDDVSTTNEYAGAINALLSKGIISGYSDGTFKPNNPITRAQMAKIIAKAFELQTSSTSLAFTDVDVRGEFAQYIKALVENEITTGTSKTTYSPLQSVTRGQLASFVIRAEKAVTSHLITIDKVENGVIYTANANYKVSKEAATLFTSANSDALKGATIDAVIKSGTIQSISTLTLNNSGVQSKPINFDAKNFPLKEITINADNVNLVNAKVDGNVIVTEKASTTLTVENSNITGQLLVERISTVAVASLFAVKENELLIEIINSSIAKLNINREDTSIKSDKEIAALVVQEAAKQLQLNVDIQHLLVENTKTLSIKGNGKVNNLEVNKAENLKIELTKEIVNLIVKNIASKISLGSNTTIGRVVTPDNSTLSDIISNVQNGQIKEMISASDAATEKPAQPSNPSTGIPTGGYTPIIVTIASIEDIKVTLGYEQPYTLPSTVSAKMSDGTTKEVNVEWSKETTFDNTKQGVYETIGKVSGYSKDVKLTITVGQVDTSALQAAINEAQKVMDAANIRVSTDGTDVLSDEKWTTKQAKTSLEAVVTKAEAFMKAPTTKAQLDVITKELQDAKATYIAAQSPGLAVKLILDANRAFQLTSSTAIDIMVDTEKVTTATVATNTAGEIELNFAPENGKAFDVSKLKNEFTFKLNQVTFIVKKGTVWTISPKLLATPTNVEVVNGRTLQLSWDKVDEATSYTIVRSDNKVIKGITSTSYEDKDITIGKSYSYQIIANNTYSLSEKSLVTNSIIAGIETTNPQKGDYVVVTNESTNITSNQATGNFKNSLSSSSLQGANVEEDLSVEEGRLNPREAIELNRKNSKVRASLQGEATETKIVEGTSKKFKTLNYMTNQYVEVEFKLFKAGTNANVWIPTTVTNFTKAAAEGLITEYETKVKPLIEDNFAPIADVDHNGTLEILVMDIHDGYQPGGSYVGGYFTGQHLLMDKVDSIVLDMYPLMSTNKSATINDASPAYETLVHELQHLVNANNEYNVENGLYAMDTWLDEALSMAAEHLYSGKALSGRIDGYNRDSYKKIANGLSVLDWQDSLDSYSLSYLFMQYLKEQVIANGKKEKELYQTIIGYKYKEQVNTTNTSDASKAAVTYAIQNLIDSSLTFEQFMTNFRIALVLQEDKGKYGFNGHIKNLNIKTRSGLTNILPGGSIVVHTNNLSIDTTNKGKDIKYTGVYTK